MPESRPFTVDEQLCFALYDASRAVVGRYRAGLASLGLTYTQYIALLALWETPTTTMTDLGERLHLDSGTLSPLLKRLEAQGLVTRRRPPSDERALEVSLTESGAALRDRVRRVQLEVEEATGLGQERLDALRADLALITARMRDEDVATA